jgi:hypothetical protein
MSTANQGSDSTLGVASSFFLQDSFLQPCQPDYNRASIVQRGNCSAVQAKLQRIWKATKDKLRGDEDSFHSKFVVVSSLNSYKSL